MLNRIAMHHIAMKNRVLGPSLSIAISQIPMETSAGTLGESPGNWRRIDSGRPTAVTDQAIALSSWSNQPEKGTMVRSMPYDRPIL